MHTHNIRKVSVLFTAATLAFGVRLLSATEYFVAPDGCDDTHDGLGRSTAFATIQRGVDALEPGDTLTILPGEYFGNVAREDLGSMEADTTIRAEIAGTALLRGDVPAPVFEPVEGYRFVYAAPFDRQPKAVLDHRHLHTLFPKANMAELEFDPGFFYYDTETEHLYISNLDLRPPDGRLYTVAVTDASGLTLTDPKRVIIEGLAATGFYPGWGINLKTPESCVVRDCVLYLCVGGINLHSGGSNNIVENCVSFGHTFSGISRYGANNDVVRNCHTYRTRREGREDHGIMSYGGMTGPFVISNNISWGQGFDYSVKPSAQGRLKNSVGLGFIRNRDMVRNLVGGGNESDRGNNASADNILFRREEDLDRDFEFADPLNLDFRLQPDSRFRASAPDGSDRGPYPYEPNIFYLSPAGDDTADGLSMRAPWQTLERALPDLRPGDTLYLAAGEYAGAVWNRNGKGGEPIRIRGRGRETVIITTALTLNDGLNVGFERLDFADGIQVRGGSEVRFENCAFFGNGEGLSADRVSDLRITHSVFAGVPLQLRRTDAVFLSGNLYANTGGAALLLDTADAIRYSDYNSYQDPGQAWRVGRRTRTLEDLRDKHERHTQVLTPVFSNNAGTPQLDNGKTFENLGPYSRDIGRHNVFETEPETLQLAGPFLHSSSDTSANIEWWSSHPANYELAWGATEQMTNRITRHSGPERFNTFSLTGLQPGQTYHFAIRSAAAVRPRDDPSPPPAALRPDSAQVTFTTAAQPRRPAVYYVAPQGNDGNSGLNPDLAFRTLNRAARAVGPGDTVMIGEGDYNETVRMRAAGAQDRPITFRAAPGERATFKGNNLQRAFEVVHKPDIRFDGLFFEGFNQGGTLFVLRQSERIHITRCFNISISAQHCPELVVQNSVVRGGQWTFTAFGLSNSPGSRIENNVFVMVILAHLSVGSSPSTQVRRNIFCENVRNKSHHRLASLRDVEESDNCFYMRWPEDEKLAINNRPLTEYRARTGSDAFAANPMFTGVTGWYQGWQRSRGGHFNDFFPTNPELVLRGIGLQPGAFPEYEFAAETWPYDREWAQNFRAALRQAEALETDGRYPEALEAYTVLAAKPPLSERLKAKVLERASICAEKSQDFERAMELARDIPAQPISMRRRMELMLAREQYAELLEAFSSQGLSGRNFHQHYLYPEQEDLMADLYLYRAIAYRKTGDLEAAEADLKIMNEKRMQLTYRSGEAIHDRVWLQLGDFYRDHLEDDDRALAAYSNVIDRTTWTFWGRPRKPAARGADETLAQATQNTIEILRRKGHEDQIQPLQLNLLQAQAEAAAAILETETMLDRFKEFFQTRGDRWTPQLADLQNRLETLPPEGRANLIAEIGKLVDGITADARNLLVSTAGLEDPGQRTTALRMLLLLAPAENVAQQLGAVEDQVRARAIREELTPVVEKMRTMARDRQWQELLDAFKDHDFAAWENDALAGEAFGIRGQANSILKNGQQAETDFSLAVERRPGDAVAWYRRGQNFQNNLQDMDQALEAYLRANQATGVNYGWLSIDSAIHAAALLRRADRRDEALKLLDRYDPDQMGDYWANRFRNARQAL